VHIRGRRWKSIDESSVKQNKKLEENERKLENMNENMGVFTIIKSSVVTTEN
jgi:hypothetical protein